MVGYGDVGGLDDLIRAQEAAHGVSIVEELEAMGNRASMLAALGRLDEARALTLEVEARSKEYGHQPILRWFQAEHVVFDFYRGERDRARSLADVFIGETGGAHYMSTPSAEIGALLAPFDNPTRWMTAAAHVSAAELREAAEV